MKKIYTLILGAVFVSNISNAQLTLTKAFNEPVIGNVEIRKGRDSVGVIPKNTGASQVWNFTSLVTNTITESATFTTVASAPSGSLYPQATMTEFDGVNSNDFIKVTASNYEFLGTYNPSIALNYTNSAIFVTWPVNMGYSNSDNFAGSAVVGGTLTGTAIGNLATNATGTGTLQLPGGLTFSNMLQVQLTQTLNLSLAFGLVTATVTAKQYMYYHGSQKFPLLTVNYSKTAGSFTAATVEIRVNNAVLTGINEATLNNDFTLYPNPSNGNVYVMLSNDKAENISVEIMNSIGQVVKTVSFGNAASINENIDLSGLPNGVYFAKTTLGEKSTIKKLIVQ